MVLANPETSKRRSELPASVRIAQTHSRRAELSHTRRCRVCVCVRALPVDHSADDDVNLSFLLLLTDDRQVIIYNACQRNCARGIQFLGSSHYERERDRAIASEQTRPFHSIPDGQEEEEEESLSAAVELRWRTRSLALSSLTTIRLFAGKVLYAQ